jgi:hypothetical protein
MAQTGLLRILSIPSDRGIWRNSQSIKGKAVVKSVAFTRIYMHFCGYILMNLQNALMDPLTKISNVLSKAAQYYLLVVLLIAFVATGVFSIGPAVLVIPAFIIAFGPSRRKQEARSKSRSMSMTFAITTFGAYILAFVANHISKAFSANFGFEGKISDQFMNAVRVETLAGYTPTALGYSQQSALIAGDGDRAELLSFLYLVEYTSMILMIPLSLLLVLRMGSVRAELKRGHDRFTEKKSVPAWIGMWLAVLLLWGAIYLMDYHNLGGRRGANALLFLAPVAGSFFMLMLASALLFIRFAVLDYLFVPEHELPPPLDVTIQRFGETDRAINSEEQNLREVFTGGRLNSPLRVSVPSNRLREGKIKNMFGQIKGLNADWNSGKLDKLRWIVAAIAFAFLLYKTGAISSEGINLERLLSGEMNSL